MMKFISSIVAFSLTFILSVALIGVPQNTYSTNFSEHSCHNSMGKKVVSLLRQDVRNGEVRRIEIKQLFIEAKRSGEFSVEQYAEYVQEYVDKSQSMDDYDLPADVRSSWRTHMKAWRDYSNFLNKLKRSEVNTNYSRFVEMDRKYSREIDQTWYKTLRIGKQYDHDLIFKIY